MSEQEVIHFIKVNDMNVQSAKVWMWHQGIDEFVIAKILWKLVKK